jgi:hypothetical protein
MYGELAVEVGVDRGSTEAGGEELGEGADAARSSR